MSFLRPTSTFAAVFHPLGIVCSAFSPIGAPNRPEIFKDDCHPILLEDSVIKSIANKHGVTVAQVDMIADSLRCRSIDFLP